MTVDLNREKRIHIHNVRYDSNKKKYTITLLDPSDNSKFDVDWDQWISFGSWQQRKRESNYY